MFVEPCQTKHQKKTGDNAMCHSLNCPLKKLCVNTTTAIKDLQATQNSLKTYTL